MAKYIRSNNIPATNIYTCTYYSDFLKFHQLVPNKSTGGFTLNQPIPGDVKMPCFDVFSLGDWVLPILEQPKKYIGEWGVGGRPGGGLGGKGGGEGGQ